MAFTIPGFVVVVCILWYSVGVWRSTDRYFRDEYKRYLDKQYKQNKYLKQPPFDHLPEEARSIAKNELIEKDVSDSNVWQDDNSQPIYSDEGRKEFCTRDKTVPQRDAEEWEEDNAPPCTNVEKCATVSKGGTTNSDKGQVTNVIKEFQNDYCPISTENEDCDN